jgi:hypothetical protein
MKVTCIHDATMRLILLPENPLESLQLKEMAEKSERGTKTALISLDGPAAREFKLEVG